MKRYATTLLVLACLAAMAGPAQAQDIIDATIRDINDISDENEQALQQNGATLTDAEIQALVRNDLTGAKVRFTAVVLSNPRNSGLATPNNEGFPGRIHVYVRDTSAVSQGVAGMTTQLVDQAFQTTGLLNLAIGDVITVVGTPSFFNAANIQVAPESIELLGPYQSLGLPDSILDPVTITTADANMAVGGDGTVIVNWANLEDLNGQYVRIEGATVLARDISSTRPNFIFTADGGQTVLNFYDASLRFRNDRGTTYNPNEFNIRTRNDGNWVPPPPGAKVNIQGFIGAPNDDPFSRGNPLNRILSIIPFEDRGCDDPASGLACDIEVTETPPEVAIPGKPSAVAEPGQPITITTTVTADPTRDLVSVHLNYFTSVAPDMVSVPMTNTSDDTYAVELPGQSDGTFIVYSVTAVDNTGAEATSSAQDFRVLAGGITSVADIQETSGHTGDASPFRGLTVPMDLTVTVQSAPGFGGTDVRAFSVQDDEDLNPNGGLFIADTEALIADLNVGDVIHITNAEVLENFNVTTLRNITYTKVSTGGAPLPAKIITTDVLKDAAVAEAHEGMLVRFVDPIITSNNPDAPAGPFGEWAFSSDGTTDNQLRADDAATSIGTDVAAGFSGWEKLEFLQGVWWFSFGNYKLVPTGPEDIGAITNVAVEDEAVPGTFALAQNYPNPFNPSTNIRYSVPAAGRVTLVVVDLLGRRVATLVDGTVPAGVYDVRFDGHDLASGLYLYRLTAGGQTITKKMMLMK